MSDLGHLSKFERKGLLVVPVHVATLIDQLEQKKYLASFTSLPSNVRRHLLFEIIGIAESVDRARGLQISRLLAPHCRGLLGRLRISDSNLQFWKQANFVAVGADVDDDPAEAEAAIIDDFQVFAGLARQHNQQCYARGLRSTSLTAAAVAAGFDYVEGTAITLSEKAGKFFGVMPFDLEDMYVGKDIAFV